MLARVVAMLTRLIDRFDTNSRTSCFLPFLLSYVHPFNRPQSVTDHDEED